MLGCIPDLALETAKTEEQLIDKPKNDLTKEVDNLLKS